MFVTENKTIPETNEYNPAENGRLPAKGKPRAGRTF
jgi:hypothetical protein